ncbi:hypothetical protein [Neisseria bergeri]|uniref:hypothetical protein n=1 Tax=Neisseria bergeri TaxID=1906581 RepID=UPI0027DFD5BB|nr:hypothetical protein [Neisseria bergeri]
MKTERAEWNVSVSQKPAITVRLEPCAKPFVPSEGSSMPDALLQKITEIKNTVDAMRAELDAVSLEELKQKFEAAFNG